MSAWSKKMPKEVYAFFRDHGETYAKANKGGCCNAYMVARTYGVIPAWCMKGTAVHAAARAGLAKYRQTKAETDCASGERQR